MLRKRRRKRGTVTRKFLFILLLAAAVVYVGGVFYYHSHFLRGTVIDRIDVSNMTDRAGPAGAGTGLFPADYRTPV